MSVEIFLFGLKRNRKLIKFGQLFGVFMGVGRYEMNNLLHECDRN